LWITVGQSPRQYKLRLEAELLEQLKQIARGKFRSVNRESNFAFSIHSSAAAGRLAPAPPPANKMKPAGCCPHPTGRKVDVSHLNQRQFGRNHKHYNHAPISGELHDSTTAAALGIVTKGYAPALGLCRALIRAGVDPETPLHLFRRNNTLALKIRSIREH